MVVVAEEEEDKEEEEFGMRDIPRGRCQTTSGFLVFTEVPTGVHERRRRRRKKGANFSFLLHRHAGDESHYTHTHTLWYMCVRLARKCIPRPALPDFQHCSLSLPPPLSPPLPPDSASSLLPEAFRFLDGEHQLLLQLLVALVRWQVQSVEAATRTR